MGAVGLGRAATGGMVRQNLEGIHDLLEGRRGNGVVAAHGNRGGKTQRRLALMRLTKRAGLCLLLPAAAAAAADERPLRSIATGACKHVKEGSQKATARAPPAVKRQEMQNKPSPVSRHSLFYSHQKQEPATMGSPPDCSKEDLKGSPAEFAPGARVLGRSHHAGGRFMF